jgi:thioredoxin
MRIFSGVKQTSSWFAFFVSFLMACSSGNSQNSLDAAAFSKEIAAQSAPQILDVRTPDEYAGGHIAGAQLADVTASSFAGEVSKIGFAKEQPLFVYCLAGSRSADAASQLTKAGYAKVINLKGGMLGWQRSNLPVTTEVPAGHVAIAAKPSASKVWTQAELDAAIKANPQVLIDFYATWCGPCKKMEPSFAQIEKEGKIKVIRVDVDVNKDLANAYSITEIPVIYAYKGTKQIMRFEGLQTLDMLTSVFK